MPFADLEILIQRWPEGGFAVDLRFRDTQSDVDTELALNVPIGLDLEELLSLGTDPADYGRRLSAMLFAPAPLREGWLRARSFVDGAGIPLRLRLRLDPGAPELHAVRWETLRDPERDQPIVGSERLLFSRYLDSADLARIDLPPRPAVSALIAVASPQNLAEFQLAPFDGAAEAGRVAAALAPIPTTTLVSKPAAVTIEAITEALRAGHDILYLVCHGTLRDGVPYLWLEDADRQVARIPGDELVRRVADLSPERRPLLVVLASCQSVGVGGGGATPTALGPQLVRAGVSAVIGMQGDVPMDLVARLVPRFFAELHRTGAVDQALAVARSALGADAPWWMPVLFLRVREGRIWEEERSPEAQPARPEPVASAPPRPRPAPLLWAGGAVALALLLALVLGRVIGGAPPQPAPTAAVLADPTPVAPTAAPSPTPAPPAPLADGRLMVLVSAIELRGGDGGALTEAVIEDLRRTVEEIPFSHVAVVGYAGPLRSEAEAAALAQASRAAVVIWGSGDTASVTLRVQVGDTGLFPQIPPELAGVVRGTADLDLRLDPRASPLPSTALAVLSVLDVLQVADGDGFAILRAAALIDRLEAEVTAAEPIGGGTAPRLHRHLRLAFSQPDQAGEVISAAIADDPANPLLLVYRGLLYQRLSQYEEAYEDAQAATDAVPGWASPLYLMAVDRMQNGFPEQSLAYVNEIARARPGDSYALAYLGAFSYLGGYDDVARGELGQAIELGPLTSMPYAFATVLDLRQGRLETARERIVEARERFRAQRSFDNNFYRNLFGQENIFGLLIAAFDQLLIGQNRDAISDAERALAFPNSDILSKRVRADLHFIIGFAECRRGDDQAALAAYTRSLELAPDFPLLYLLRAEVLSNLGEGSRAQADLESVLSGLQSERLEPLVSAALRGEVSCLTILE